MRHDGKTLQLGKIYEGENVCAPVAVGETDATKTSLLLHILASVERCHCNGKAAG